jgi:hypothetical protein
MSSATAAMCHNVSTPGMCIGALGRQTDAAVLQAAATEASYEDQTSRRPSRPRAQVDARQRQLGILVEAAGIENRTPKDVFRPV